MKDKKTGKIETRSYEFEVRAVEKDGEKIIEGRPIVYESVTDLGWFKEVIDRGALDGTDLKDVRFLVNHDQRMIPLARSRRNNSNSTMRLSTDYDGMSIDYIRLDTENNNTSRALYSAVERGDITGMSFGFIIAENGDYWVGLETDHPTRHITKIESVIEISAVTFPAYESTEIYARSNEALESARSTLERARELNVRSLDRDNTEELEVLKAKLKILMEV